MSAFTDEAKHILGTVAPMIATATLGPFAPLANTLISKVFGTTPGDSSAASAALAAATPDQLLALKKAEEDFQVQMKQLNISEEKLTFDDTASARNMAVQTKDSTPRYLSYMLLIFTGAVIAATMLGYTKVDSALAGSLVGYLVSENKAVMQFWFGSSAGSQSKDSTISDMAKQA